MISLPAMTNLSCCHVLGLSTFTNMGQSSARRKEIEVMLLRNADYIITVDGARRVLRQASIFIDRGRIAAIGSTEAIDSQLRGRVPPEAVIDASQTLIAPGFINTHVHTFEHLSRGLIPDNLPTRPWALGYFFPFQAEMTEREAYISARLACLDMVRCGTTCFIDSSILNHNRYVDAVVQAIDDLGMRAVLGRGVCDRPPPDLPSYFRADWRRNIFSPSADAALADAESLLRAWKVRSGGRIRAWATLFGLFTLCSDELFTGIKRLADAYGVGTNFHIASSLGEAEELEARTGVWPITQLERLRALGPNVLLTHAVAVRDQEVATLARHSVKIAHCPGAALRLAKGAGRLGKIPEMLASGIPVSLGADGVCSSGTFDHTRLLFLVAGLFKDARMDATLIPAETALEMATLNGAKGLLWEDEIGSLEVGKKADLIQYDIRRPEWVPPHDVVRNLVYSADGGSIKNVIVDGRLLVQDRRPMGVDEGKIVDEACEAGLAIARRVGLDPQSKWLPQAAGDHFGC
jgi:cytosine/adenosine deaminase-related metal-dependent hydrolase